MATSPREWARLYKIILRLERMLAEMKWDA
jgi:hypothetical protein